MVEGGSGDGGPESGPRSKAASSFESAGGRLRFTVELRPGETTIVSWKKLLKEATSSKPSGLGPSVPGPSPEEPISQPPPPPPPLAVPSSSKQPVENEGKDAVGQGGSNLLSDVIERIERMYAGNGSSDEEDVVLDDVPDDDEYDTEDSFIDDTELDDYFQVDNSTIKHDGFFVNRGKLERTEATVAANQQPKKRRRKDLTKGTGGSDDGRNPSKHVKIGNKGRQTSTPIERSSASQPHREALPNVNSEGMLSPTSTVEVPLNKKTVDTKIMADSSGLSNGDGIKLDKDADLQKTVVALSKNYNKKLKGGSEIQDVSTPRLNEKSLHLSNSHSGKQINNADVVDQSVHRKEKGGLVGRFDLNVPASRDTVPNTKLPLVQRKEGSSVRPKSSMLDKAIRELEKVVAESRPPSTEVQDPDNSSQAVKRRLSPEIKQKLAKVARLAQASYGKIPKDVINRLMSILGHLMQVRTLKRNLKILANMGLSAKQEKDERVQKIKQEVADMVKLRMVYIKSKIEQTTNSDDFQETSTEEKEALKRKHSMDEPLENKICELYDLYAERAEEDSGPPVRRLYEELAALWPSGIMDTDGIKRAICKAKDRRKALGNRKRDQERIRKKKVLTPKTENPVHGEATNNVAQAVDINEKILPDSRDHGSSLTTKTLLPNAVPQAAGHVPVAFSNGPHHVGKPKPEKVKGSCSSNPTDIILMDIVPKKKVKRKPPNIEGVESQYSLEKLMASHADEKHKHKHVVGSVSKSNLQSVASSGSENQNPS